MFRAGQQLDRFVLVRVAGEGGQGTVWKAEDTTRPGAFYALKLVPLPAGGSEASAHVARLRREAQALSRLAHPGLVRCHGLFEDYAQGALGLVLDWVEGQPLGEASADPRMTLEHRHLLLRHLAFALSRLHEEGLVHRDVKFANVLVSSSFYELPADPTNVKLVDLGVVVPVSNPRPLTELGNVVGTVAYMAPELADATYDRALSANPAADVFAFGVLGWRLLTGEHPTGLGFDADFMDYFLAYRAALVGEMPWPAKGEVPGLWGGLLRSCLSLRLEHRPATGADLRETIEGATLRMPPVSSILKPSSELSVGYRLPTAPVAPSTPRRQGSLPQVTQPLAVHGSRLPPSSRPPPPPVMLPDDTVDLPAAGPMAADPTVDQPAERPRRSWVIPVGIALALLAALAASAIYLLK